jgi:hypothetical protein
VLKVSAVVFRVLAWVALALQVVAGLILLIAGGEPVAIGGVGGFELPARVVGILNFVAAAVYFCTFWFLSAVVQVLLEIRSQVAGGSVGPGRV